MPEITEIISTNRRELLLICLINYQRLIVCHRRVWIIRLNRSWYSGAWPGEKVYVDECVTPCCDQLMSLKPFCKCMMYSYAANFIAEKRAVHFSFYSELWLG